MLTVQLNCGFYFLPIAPCRLRSRCRQIWALDISIQIGLGLKNCEQISDLFLFVVISVEFS